MLLYLDHAWDRFQAAGRLNTPADLHDAIIEGAVQRIRPKIMTVCAILFGLLPIMWSPTTQAGADVMKRIAAPMIGGVVTSAILELLLYPAIYMLWRRRHLPNPRGPEMSFAALKGPTGPVRRRRLTWSTAILLMLAAGAGLYWWLQERSVPPATASMSSGTPFATRTVNGITVNFYHPLGGLTLGENEVLIEFRDSATAAPIDVGTVTFALDMNMPGMVMHAGATISLTGGIGQYRAKIKPDMAGDWTSQLSYHGPHGSGEISFTVNVKT